ncbi:MAG: hypothetical protein EP332_12730 [Bacteroidetes bacterium]|nr:MAG: hypothetical protein EP332_12730 [Bacteroidota bacterium]
MLASDYLTTEYGELFSEGTERDIAESGGLRAERVGVDALLGLLREMAEGWGQRAERRGVEALIMCLRTGLTTEFAVLCGEGTERDIAESGGLGAKGGCEFREIAEGREHMAGGGEKVTLMLI